jgi:hypothetical protein
MKNEPDLNWKKCFCEVDFTLVERYGREHFVEQTPTVTLLHRATTEDERDAIIAVTMLSIPPPRMLELCELSSRDCGHTLMCCQDMRRKLCACGIPVPNWTEGECG